MYHLSVAVSDLSWTLNLKCTLSGTWEVLLVLQLHQIYVSSFTKQQCTSLTTVSFFGICPCTKRSLDWISFYGRLNSNNYLDSKDCWAFIVLPGVSADNWEEKQTFLFMFCFSHLPVLCLCNRNKRVCFFPVEGVINEMLTCHLEEIKVPANS